MKRLVAALFALALFALAAPASARSSGAWSYNSAGRGGGTWQGFSPTWISNVKLWFRADRGITLDGSSNVSQWNDLSGNGANLIQATSTARPSVIASDPHFGNQSSVSFLGSSSQTLATVTSVNISPPFTTVLVGYTVNGNNQFCGSTTISGLIAAQTVDWVYDSGLVITAPPGTLGSPTMLIAVQNGATTLYINSTVAAGSGNAGTNAMAGSYILAGASLSNHLTGQIAEGMVIGSALDSGQRAQVARYISARYAIAIN